MYNLYSYYNENKNEAFNAMKENGLEELIFPDDIEFPSILICDNEGYIVEGSVSGAKIKNDKLVLIVEHYESDEDEYLTSEYSTDEIPYLSMQDTFETIVKLVEEYIRKKRE